MHFLGPWAGGGGGGGGRLSGMLLTGPDLRLWRLFIFQEQSCGHQNPRPSPRGPELANAGLRFHQA